MFKLGVSNPKVSEKGRFLGSLMQDKCDTLESIVQMKCNGESLPFLENTIYNIDDEAIKTALESGNFEFEDKRLGKLRPNQTLGLAYMYHAKQCILGDSVGLGKTVQCAALINIIAKDLGRKPKVLYLTEKRVVHQSAMELVKFTGMEVVMVSSLADDCKKFITSTNFDDLTIVVGAHSLANQQIFQSYVANNRKDKEYMFDLLVVDESSVLGNSATQIYKSMKMLRDVSDRVVLMNATPFENKLDVFYNQVDFLGKDILITKDQFNKKYKKFDTLRQRGYLKEYKNQDEFKDSILYFYFYNTRKNLGATVKDSSVELCLCELTQEQEKLMQLSSMHQLIYDNPDEVSGESIPFIPERVPKLGVLLDLLKGFGTEQVLVFSHYKSTHTGIVEYLERIGIVARYINGETPKKEADEALMAFKGGTVQVLVTNLKRGLNLGFCDNVVFYSYSSNPAELLQMEGRVTRDFDIVGKQVKLICSKGKEYEVLKDKVAKTMKYSDDFSTVDTSLIGEFLMNNFKD